MESKKILIIFSEWEGKGQDLKNLFVNKTVISLDCQGEPYLKDHMVT